MISSFKMQNKARYMVTILLLYYFLILNISTVSADRANLHKFGQPAQVRQTLELVMNETGKTWLQNNSIIHYARQATVSLGAKVSENCKNAATTLLDSAKRGENWALRMLDATGKPFPSGILVGNLMALGSFWECTNSSATLVASDATYTTIRGQYCRVSFSMVNQTNLEEAVLRAKWGVCIPDACNSTELSEFIEVLLSVARDLPGIGGLANNLAVVELVCQINDPELSGLAISGICIAVAFGSLVLIGSAYDTLFTYSSGHIARAIGAFFRRFAVSPFAAPAPAANNATEDDQSLLIQNNEFNSNSENTDRSNKRVQKHSTSVQVADNTESEQRLTGANAASSSTSTGQVADSTIGKVEQGVLGKFLSTFSIRLNGAAIFSTKPSDEQLDCLHGIRFISMVWIIIGHIYGAAVLVTTDLLLAVDHYMNSWTFQVFWNATFSVDTFFVISGLLTTYVTLKYVGRVGGPGRFKWHLFYIHRYLRLTPVYGFAIFMFVSLFPYLANGPFWIQQVDQSCTQYWWTNLLYINNFYNTTAMCFPHAWYLANDMQFFIISPIAIIAFFFSPLAGVVVIIAFVVVSVVSTAVITSANQFSPIFLLNMMDPGKTDSFGPITENNDIYIKPYCRVGSYAIGMLVGYILHRTKRTMTLNPWTVILGWLMSTALACSVLFCLYDATRGATVLTTAGNAAYLSLSRIAWSISIGWIILACSTGYGGWINNFLSWKAFAPLSRLTYCAYLVHPPLLAILFYYVDTACDIREFPMFYYAAGDVVLSYGVALAFSLAIEAPFFRLEKLLFGRE